MYHLRFSPLGFQISLSLYLGSPQSFPVGLLPPTTLPSFSCPFWELAHRDPIDHLFVLRFSISPTTKVRAASSWKKREGTMTSAVTTTWSVPPGAFELPPL